MSKRFCLIKISRHLELQFQAKIKSWESTTGNNTKKSWITDFKENAHHQIRVYILYYQRIMGAKSIGLQKRYLTSILMRLRHCGILLRGKIIKLILVFSSSLEVIEGLMLLSFLTHVEHEPLHLWRLSLPKERDDHSYDMSDIYAKKLC